MIDVAGYLYVAHFDPPYRHARHYVGWSATPDARETVHRSGQGSPLIRAAVGAGSVVTFHVIGTGTRADERRLHRRHGASRFCPTCRRRCAIKGCKRRPADGWGVCPSCADRLLRYAFGPPPREGEPVAPLQHIATWPE